MEQLPVVSYPYISEMEFLKEVKNVEGKAKKKHFKDERITSPFYFYLKMNEIENNGVLKVVFYKTPPKEVKKDVKEVPKAAVPNGSTAVPPPLSVGSTTDPVREYTANKRMVEKSFEFGESGKYYEYIIFFDVVENLSPGKYRYGVFCNDHLIYEDGIIVNEGS